MLRRPTAEPHTPRGQKGVVVGGLLVLARGHAVLAQLWHEARAELQVPDQEALEVRGVELNGTQQRGGGGRG